MIVNRIHFISFLEAIKLSGDIKIDEVLLNFTERGLEIVADVPYNVGQVRALIVHTFFEDYIAYGEVGIDNITELTNILKHFKTDNINLTIEGSALIITSEDKQMLKQLVDPRYITQTKVIELQDYTSMFELTALQIRILKSEAKTNKCETISIASTKGEVTITNEGNTTINTKIKSETSNAEELTSFNKNILDLLSNKTKESTIEIWYGSNLPAVINFKTDSIKIQYIVYQIAYNVRRLHDSVQKYT